MTRSTVILHAVPTSLLEMRCAVCAEGALAKGPIQTRDLRKQKTVKNALLDFSRLSPFHKDEMAQDHMAKIIAEAKRQARSDSSPALCRAVANRRKQSQTVAKNGRLSMPSGRKKLGAECLEQKCLEQASRRKACHKTAAMRRERWRESGGMLGAEMLFGAECFFGAERFLERNAFWSRMLGAHCFLGQTCIGSLLHSQQVMNKKQGLQKVLDQSDSTRAAAVQSMPSDAK